MSIVSNFSQNKFILDPGYNLTLRPMQYPDFYEMYKIGVKNNWTVEEIDFSTDISDLDNKITESERHLISRLIAFFATGDNIVANNLVLNLYNHINSPEARMYLSRQLFEEALHIQFYLTLLDNYVPDVSQREEMFRAVETIPSIRKKAEFCFRWMDTIYDLREIRSDADAQKFILNLACFATCIEGLFFFGAFAYVYYLKSKGLFHGLATGTNWTLRDETCVDEQTEILTSAGWQKFDQLSEKSEVAQFDMNSEEISFVRPLKIIKKRYSGEMYGIRNVKGGIDQLLTPDHDVVYKWSFQKRFEKKKVSEFKSNASLIRIPVAGYKQGKRKQFTAEDKLFIAIQADGSISSRYTGERCGTIPVQFSFSKQRKIDRLMDIISELGLTYVISYKKVSNKYPNRKDQTLIKVYVPVAWGASKEFTDWVDITRIDYEWGQNFIQELLLWDGHIPKGAPDGSGLYSSANKKNIEIVQQVALLSGYSTAISTVVDSRKSTYKTMYRIFFSKKPYIACSKKLFRYTEQYDGNVYCVSVPSGAIVIRRNGKVSITGNCHINFALKVLETVKLQRPDLFTPSLYSQMEQMLQEAVECEYQFAIDALDQGVTGLSLHDMRQYLEFVANQRREQLSLPVKTTVLNPFPFMELQDLQELTNFFERRVSAYQVAVSGDVKLDADF